MDRKLYKQQKTKVVINGIASDCAPVISGVPQGSVLGHVLVLIYINDIDVGLNNFISKFADDTKIRNSIITDHMIGYEPSGGSEKDFRMVPKMGNALYNVNKCHILQVGTRNKKKN